MSDPVADLIARLKSGGSTQDRLDAIEMLERLQQENRELKDVASTYEKLMRNNS